MDFDETWLGWSTHGPLQVLLFFSQTCPWADPGSDVPINRDNQLIADYLQNFRLSIQIFIIDKSVS